MLRQEQGGESAAIDSTSVNAKPVGRQQGFVEDGVAKDHRLAEFVGGVDELLSCPQAPLWGLLAEMTAGLQSGMHVNGMLVFPE